LSSWRAAGHIRPVTPSNPARDHPPENVVHRPVMYHFSTPTDDNYLIIINISQLTHYKSYHNNHIKDNWKKL